MKLFPRDWHAFQAPAITWGIFLLAGIALYVAQYRKLHVERSLVGFFKFCFPLQGWLSTSNGIDIVMFVVSKLIGGVMRIGELALTAAVAGFVAGGLGSLFPGHQPAAAGGLEIALCGVGLFIAGDFANFFTHYLAHKVPFLWELHKVHHSAAFLTPLTSRRFHPLNDKLDSLGGALIVALPAGVAVFLLGLSLAETAAIVGAAGLAAMVISLEPLHHSHYPISFGPLDRVLMSPHMHQLHHSAKFEHWDKNLGNRLSFFDWIFGTAFKPSPDEALTYGIGRGAAVDARYKSLYGVYLYPVLGMVRALLGQRSPHEREPIASLAAQEHSMLKPTQEHVAQAAPEAQLLPMQPRAAVSAEQHQDA